MACQRLVKLVLLLSLVGRNDAAVDSNAMARVDESRSLLPSKLNGERDLRVGATVPSGAPHKEKKPKTNSKKSKVTKKHSMGMMKPSRKGKGSKATEDEDSKKGMKQKKSSAPIAMKTDAPSQPADTSSPISSPVPVPIAAPSSVPVAAPTPTPMVATEAPVTMSPTEPPVPDNVVFIDSGNILVSYNTSLASPPGPVENLELDQILAAVNLTCAYIQTQAIYPLGALEFACLWFLTDDNDDSSMFPIQIVYSGTAPFYTNTTVTADDLDDAIVNAFVSPQVDSLTLSLMTELDMTNPFSLTTSITAAKLDRSTNSSS